VIAGSFNEQVAELLRETAAVLEQQEANPFRVNAYRHAAQTISQLDEDLREILERDGVDGLIALPGIGRSIAASIREIAATGGLARLQRLRGELEPEQLFQTLPGVGPDLAAAIHERLDIDTLEALEIAAHDGRLDAVKGVGPRRAAAIRAGLASLLGRRPRPRVPDGPDVAMLLALDRKYRSQARAGRLPTIAPKRFNPEGKAWLPIMHADRKPWHFTVLFSNTARAHQLKRTSDWVVIYFENDAHQSGQHTVVTETRGGLRGKRVVRGREADCRAYYRRGNRAGVRRDGRRPSVARERP
jgi:putative hydrolase